MSQSRKWWTFGGIILLLSLLALQTLSIAAHHTIKITDSGFQPNVIHGKINETLRLTIINQGNKPHNFIAPEFFMYTHNLQSGEKVTVEFTLNKTGTFTFYSDAPGYIEEGLQGNLIIE